MSLDTNTDVEEVRGSLDKDGDEAHIASDERLEEVRQQGENHSAVAAGQYTVNEADTDESLPAQPIPDGVEVVVAYDPSNAGVVYVGGGTPAFPLTDVGQAVSLRVTDLSEIEISAPNVGDGVRYIAEVTS